MKINSILAGLYISLGAFFMLTVGAVAPDSIRSLLMGLVFSLSLILIILGQCYLFTGKCLTDTLNYLFYKNEKNKYVVVDNKYGKKIGNLPQLSYRFFGYWVGNFVGCLLGVILFINTCPEVNFLAFLSKISVTKVSYPVGVLISKAIFCNLLVCSAVWLTRLTDCIASKILIIIFCVTAFVVCGYEHSIANMAILSLGGAYGYISIPEVFYNLIFATIGNMISGIGLAFLIRNKY